MARSLTYTYVDPSKLTDSERWTLFSLRKGVGFMQDNFPDELDAFLGNLSRNRSTADLSTNKATALFIQRMQEDFEADGDLQLTKSDLMAAVPNTDIANAYSAQYGTMSPNFAGEYIYASGETNPAGCDIGECSIHIYNPYATCYEWCQAQEGNYDPNDFGGQVSENEQGFSFGNFFGGIIDGVGEIAQDIGWDNIWNTFTNTDDNGQSPDAPDVNINIQQEETNWGRIALMAGITIAVGVCIYFLIKRNKN